ncbi:MAG: PAS domain S-box protein [Halapricum sp.]
MTTDSIPTVTLFIADDRDRQLLAEWLGEAYEVSTRAESRVGVGTDLVLVDVESFPQLKSGLREWKEGESPVFAPVLLVAEDEPNESFDPSQWETIDGLYIVDDVVSTPIEKAVLYRRLENLLERRELSEELAAQYRRSEQRFERLFEEIPDLTVVLDSEDYITAINQAFRAMTGLDTAADQSVQLSDIEAFPPETVALIEQRIEAVLANETIDEQPIVRLETPAGETRYVSVSAAALQFEQEQEVIVVLRDVTERRRRERELERTEQRFRQIAGNVSEVIWLTSIEGELLYVSPGYEELTGRTEADLSADPVALALEHVHPDDRERFAEYTETVFSEPASQDVHTIEYRLVDESGETRWIRTESYPVYGPDGSVTRLVGILDDVTERKQRERRFDAIFNQTFQLTGLVDPDGTIIEVNDRAVEYLDFDRDTIVGSPIWEGASSVLRPDARDRLAEHVDRAADGEFVRYEEAVTSAEGTATLDISIKPITDSFGEVVLLIVEARDVSERKERERELARKNERLEEFASIVSHDLRNPLQIIRARMGIARDTGDLEHLDAAEDAVARMDRLIDDLLDLARHGDLSVDGDTISIEEIASRAWLSVDPTNAEIEVDAPDSVDADPDRLAQLLENLFRNALEHGTGDDEDGPVSIRVGQTDDGFFVADDGPGVPEDKRDSIFELGHTTDNNSTGFGLTIVAEIVEAHGWSVEVADDPNLGGTRFEISGVEHAE